MLRGFDLSPPTVRTRTRIRIRIRIRGTERATGPVARQANGSASAGCWK
jgi:hypothetical protein